MRITGIKETCLYIDDLEAAETFYSDIMEFELIMKVEGNYIFYRIGPSVLLIFNPASSRQKQSPPSHYGEGKIHIAFEVSPSDYEEIKRQVEDRGVHIIDVVTWKNGQESFYFHDPFDNVLEVVPVGIWEE